ncbi:hypothetical protein DERF_008262 [Dermatophagoides farinae]|uniref:Uncharacterized protein n=1 Tax=Dermatophagoides farinae TaxID=6954 RepID=A0A922L6T3_DERFA|nr:hypothetical protein DERF_008262 [Dermatophagoides farinae]
MPKIDRNHHQQSNLTFDFILILLAESIIRYFYRSFQTNNFRVSIFYFLINIAITIVISLTFYMAIQHHRIQIKRELIYLIMFLLIMIPTFTFLVLMEKFSNLFYDKQLIGEIKNRFQHIQRRQIDRFITDAFVN